MNLFPEERYPREQWEKLHERAREGSRSPVHFCWKRPDPGPFPTSRRGKHER